MLQLRNIADRHTKLWNIVKYGGPCILRTYGPKIKANLEFAIRNISLSHAKPRLHLDSKSYVRDISI
jgi:hypothetical protein